MKVAVCTRHVGTNALTGADQIVIPSYRALTRFDTANQYIGYHETWGRWAARAGLPVAATALWSDVILKNTTVPLWARLRGIDVHLHLAPPICFTETRIPQVCFIYDVPKDWENSGRLDRLFNRWFNRGSGMRANHLVTISEFCKQDIMSTYGLPADRISVVYCCKDMSVFNPQAALAPALQEKLAAGGARDGFVLGVLSRLVDRKNPRAYFESYARLPADLRRRHKLVIAAPCRTLDELKTIVPDDTLRAIADDVVLLGKVQQADVAGLCARARVLLFPSRFEGFGLPVIEGMACGALVVTSNIPAITEISGGTIPLHDPEDWAGQTERMRLLLENDAVANEVRQRCFAWASRFSFESFAASMSQLLRNVHAASRAGTLKR